MPQYERIVKTRDRTYGVYKWEGGLSREDDAWWCARPIGFSRVQKRRWDQLANDPALCKYRLTDEYYVVGTESLQVLEISWPKSRFSDDKYLSRSATKRQVSLHYHPCGVSLDEAERVVLAFDDVFEAHKQGLLL